MGNIEELLELIKTNPDLPVIPMVDTEVVCGDEFGYWMAQFGKCSIREFVADDHAEGIIRYKDELGDEDSLIESIAEYKYDGTFEAYDKAKEEVDSMWIKAIIVKIELPD